MGLVPERDGGVVRPGLPAVLACTISLSSPNLLQVAAIGRGRGSGKRFSDASSRVGPLATFKVAVADQTRYQGATVACTSVPRGADLVPEPVVAFEVLSAAMAATDFVQTNGEYWLTPPIRRSVVP